MLIEMPSECGRDNGAPASLVRANLLAKRGVPQIVAADEAIAIWSRMVVYTSFCVTRALERVIGRARRHTGSYESLLRSVGFQLPTNYCDHLL
jgi:hypothetical protein